jgi:hypothetical protein
MTDLFLTQIHLVILTAVVFVAILIAIIKYVTNLSKLAANVALDIISLLYSIVHFVPYHLIQPCAP